MISVQWQDASPQIVLQSFRLVLALPRTPLSCHGSYSGQEGWSARLVSEGSICNPPLNEDARRNDPQACDRFCQCNTCESVGKWWHRLRRLQCNRTVSLDEFPASGGARFRPSCEVTRGARKCSTWISWGRIGASREGTVYQGFPLGRLVSRQ